MGFFAFKGVALAQLLASNKHSYIAVDDEDLERIKQHKWHLDSYGYAMTEINGKTISMHRHLMSPEGGAFVDHINGNKSDNRKINLRLCTHAENMRNRKRHKNNKSGFKGVYASASLTSPWRAQIRCDGAKYDLGCFSSALKAKAAYDAAAKEMHKEFARL